MGRYIRPVAQRGRNSEAIRMAYVPAHLLNSSAKRRNRVQSDAGVAAAFLVASYVGCLDAGDLAANMRRKQPPLVLVFASETLRNG
jgi:hypothetical protein